MRSIAFLAPDFLANPWPRYARFRAEQPVWWSDEIRMFCVFRHRDIRACLTGADYTVEYPFRVSRQVFGETLLDLDGPRHQRLRRPLAGLLLGQRDNIAFRAAAGERARTAVAALPADTVLDMVAGPARAVPLTATATFLGVPAERHDWLLHTVEYLVGHLDGSSGDFGRASALRAELEEYLLGLITSGAPPRSMLGEVHGWVRDGEITAREAVGLATLTLAAGFETSTGLISNTLHCLARHPGHAAAAAADPAGCGRSSRRRSAGSRRSTTPCGSPGGTPRWPAYPYRRAARSNSCWPVATGTPKSSSTPRSSARSGPPTAR